METKNGIFIVLEGGEGSGKTTIAKKLVQEFNNEDIKAIYTREPGGDQISEKIRDIAINSDNIDPYTQLLLFVAARKRNIDLNINPALARNDIVICDRYTLSTLVYQGIVQGIPKQKILDLLIATECDLVKPDIEIILNVDPKIGLDRVMSNDREVSSIDKKGLEFHSKVNKAYLHNSYINKYGYRCVINANKNLSDVFDNVDYVIRHIIKIDERFKNIPGGK